MLSTVRSVQGLPLFLIGQVIANSTSAVSLAIAGDLSAGPGTYVFPTPDVLKVTVPISEPFSIDLAGGLILNGTASGQFVANAMVPEPSNVVMAGLGLALIAACGGRQRRPARRLAIGALLPRVQVAWRVLAQSWTILPPTKVCAAVSRKRRAHRRLHFIESRSGDEQGVLIPVLAIE